MLKRMQDFLERTRLNRLINGETIRYAIFGVVTSCINIGLFFVLDHIMPYRAANLIAVITAKLAAYFCNRIFVFRSTNEGGLPLIREIVRYIYTRGLTLLVDYFGLILLVDVLGGRKQPMKLIITALVVILNYILGKFLVFRGKKDGDNVQEAEKEL